MPVSCMFTVWGELIVNLYVSNGSNPPIEPVATTVGEGAPRSREVITSAPGSSAGFCGLKLI